MSTCQRCSTRIQPGRQFCIAHYMEEVAKYEERLAAYHAQLADYQTDLANWNRMSADEQQQRHLQAESNAITGYALAVGLAIGALAWYGLSLNQTVETWVGILMLIGGATLCVLPQPIRVLIGRSARLMVKSVIYFLVLFVIGWVVSIFVPFMKENASALIGLLAIACIGLSIWLELSGGHHASGAPVKPTMPTRPSP